MLTSEQLVNLIDKRRANGESLSSIGKHLGVSHAAVQRWIVGRRNPSDSVLILAELLWLGAKPEELPAGLPEAS